MTETEIKKALECCAKGDCDNCNNDFENCYENLAGYALDLINRKNAEIDRLKSVEKSHQVLNGELRKEVERLTINMNAFGLGMKRESERADTARAEAIKEVFAKVDETLKRYSNLHKHAEKAMHNTEEYADGMPMEMVSVWEVLSLKKWEMADYENMCQLQENIETISKARLLEEIEKDFRLLAKEMGVEL